MTPATTARCAHHSFVSRDGNNSTTHPTSAARAEDSSESARHIYTFDGATYTLDTKTLAYLKAQLVKHAGNCLMFAGLGLSVTGMVRTNTSLWPVEDIRYSGVVALSGFALLGIGVALREAGRSLIGHERHRQELAQHDPVGPSVALVSLPV